MKQTPLAVPIERNHITLIDFEDSFTYNIVAELFKLGENVRVVPYRDAAKFFEKFSIKKKHVIVYGPGPGHPLDYALLFPFIKKLFNVPQIFHLGICLGHQILWHIRGIPTKRSNCPMHGQRVLFTIPSWSSYFSQMNFGRKVKVQRYNSLSLDFHPEKKNLDQRKQLGEEFVFFNNECQSGRFPQGLTYQFHPESIGTSYPKIFFDPILKFLYNEIDGKNFVAN